MGLIAEGLLAVVAIFYFSPAVPRVALVALGGIARPIGWIFSSHQRPRLRLLPSAATFVVSAVMSVAWAKPVTVPETVWSQLQKASAAGGAASVLKALRAIVKERPELVADPETARQLAVGAARRIDRGTALREGAYGAIGEVIIAAAPVNIRPAVASSVTNGIIHLALSSTPTDESGPRAPTPHQRKGAKAESRVLTATPDGTGAATGPKQPLEQTQQPWFGRDGLRVGKFRIYADATVTEMYDHNIFATRRDRVDDFLTIGSVSARVASDFDRHQLELRARTDVTRHMDNTREDTEDYGVAGDGRFDITKNFNVFGGGSFARDHEDRESPDDVFGIEPTRFDNIHGYAGTFGRLGDFSIRAGGTFQRLDFADVPSEIGIINNDDRDRNLYTGGMRLAHRFSPRFEVFVQGAADVRQYDSVVDDNGFNRDSTGYRAIAGTRINLPDILQADIYAGYMRQDYEDVLLKDASAPAFGAVVSLSPGPGTTLRGFLDRSVEETTLFGASSSLDTRVGIVVRQALGTRTTGTVRIGYTRRDYQGIERIDDIIDTGAAVRYYFHPNLFVSAEYAFETVDSSITEEDYGRNRVFVRLGAETTPGFPAARANNRRAKAASDLSRTMSGFYVGVQGGHAHLSSTVVGPRGPMGDSTIVEADFGDDGGVWGVFGGYNYLFNSWMLGLEVEGDTSNASWEFDRNIALERQFLVERGFSFGPSVRIGVTVWDRALIYGRAGVVWNEFRTRYETPSRVIDQTNRELGLRFGAGVEMQVLPSAFARIDYTHTTFNGYTLNYVTGVDSFENEESLLRAGIGFRF